MAAIYNATDGGASSWSVTAFTSRSSSCKTARVTERGETMILKLVVLAVLLMLAGCTTIRTARVYQDGSGTVMEALVADDWSGSGEMRFVHFDGEKFTGNYTSISEGVYNTSLTGIVGVAGRNRSTLIPSISSSSSRTQYGLASLAGDRGTSVKCVYIASLISMFPAQANTTGVCKDSQERMYTIHYTLGGDGARFPDEKTKAPDETEKRVRTPQQ